jgi:hypothetical protein
MLNDPVIIGSTGVMLLLGAFFLNLFRMMKTDSYAYMLMNVAGGGLSCYASLLINFIPFAVLEGT